MKLDCKNGEEWVEFQQGEPCLFQRDFGELYKINMITMYSVLQELFSLSSHCVPSGRKNKAIDSLTLKTMFTWETKSIV